MADVTYTVEVQYLTKGNLFDGIMRNANGVTANIRRMEQTFIGSMANSFGSLFSQNFRTTINNRILPEAEKSGSAFGSMFSANMLSAFVTSGIEAAATGMFHAIKIGILEMNADIEQLGITLATSFAGTGQTKNFEEGLSAAHAIIAKMRIDARELPGEFKDLASIMQRVNTPAANAGMSIQDTEKLAAAAMAIGVGNKLPADVVGREIGDFIQGNVRKNQPMLKFLLNLKEDPHTLNQMTQGKRIERLKTSLGMIEGTKEFEAATAMRKAFMHSWVGLWSTFKDNARTFLGALTDGLFKSIKGSLDQFNDWFENNQGKIVDWAKNVGKFLAEGFKAVEQIVLRMEPYIVKMGEIVNARHGTSTMQRDAGVAMGAFSALQVARLTPALAGAELGGAALGGTALAVVAPLAAALFGIIEGLSNNLGPLYDAFHMMLGVLKQVGAEILMRLKHSFTLIWPPLKRVLEIFGYLTFTTFVSLVSALDLIITAMDKWITKVEEIGNAIRLYFIDKLKFVETATAGIIDTKPVQSLLMGDKLPYGVLGPALDPEVPYIPEVAPLKKQEPPVHNTTIHRVEIHVNSNQDPNRVARRTVDVLNDMVRHPNAYYRAGIPRLSF